METIDLYDKNKNKLNKTFIRKKDTLLENEYYLLEQAWIVNDEGKILLTQRGLNKSYGGMWEATAGGSALQGEDPMTCALRELSEETGIKADKLTEVGRVLHHLHKSIYVDYLCETDADKSGVVLQEGETSAYKWVTSEELRSMPRNELATQRMLNFIKDLK